MVMNVTEPRRGSVLRSRTMEAAMWSAIALVALISTGTLFLMVQRLDALSTRIDVRFDALSTRIDAQGAELGARIDALGLELGARIDALSARVDTQGADLGARIDALSGRLDTHIGRHAS
jgi:hypothetical protein